MTEQLVLDLPDVTPDDFSDLNFDGIETRLDLLDHTAARRDPFDAVDFAPPAAAPKCECDGPLVLPSEHGPSCWKCGREVDP